MLIHLDTDIGGDIDDLCALAMLLRWPGVEVTGITTCGEAAGRRAGYARRVLRLEGREEIHVAAGADAPVELGYPDEERYWGASAGARGWSSRAGRSSWSRRRAASARRSPPAARRRARPRASTAKPSAASGSTRSADKSFA